jgi:hypothetical protein
MLYSLVFLLLTITLFGTNSSFDGEVSETSFAPEELLGASSKEFETIDWSIRENADGNIVKSRDTSRTGFTGKATDKTPNGLTPLMVASIINNAHDIRLVRLCRSISHFYREIS